MDGYKTSIEITIVLLKKRMITNKDTTAERLTLTMDDCKIFHKINTESIKEWMTATLSVSENDTLLQRMDSFN